VSQGLRNVVDTYSLDGHRDVTIATSSATSTATTTRLRGQIERQDNTTTRFIADLYAYEDTWKIRRFVVVGRESSMTKQQARRQSTQTLSILADAIESDNYQPLYAHLGQKWRQNTSAQELAGAYNALSEQKQTQIIDAIRNDEPRVTRDPAVNQRGDTHFEVTYENAPLRLTAQLIYQHQDGEWQPVSIDLRRSEA